MEDNYVEVKYVCPSCESDNLFVFYNDDGGDDTIMCEDCGYVSGWLGFNEIEIKNEKIGKQKY